VRLIDSTGSAKWNVLPAASSLSAHILPPWASTMPFAMCKPMPRPLRSRRDQLVGETTFAQQILVGGFALDLEKVVHIASSRIALELEQSIGASALPTACAVLLSSLKLGTRSGVLKQARIDAD